MAKGLTRDRLTKEQLVEALEKHGNYHRAAKHLQVSYSVLLTDLKYHNLYKRVLRAEYKLEDILSNKFFFDAGNLKKRLIKELNWKNQCNSCGITQWQSKPISMQLDHINGNRQDNSLSNLQLLCPNCHAQTSTFGTKNRVRYKTRKIRVTKPYKDL